MSKLLARAKVSLRHAKMDYQEIAHDDAYLDSCCFSLQQAIEMALKFMIEMAGGRYVMNHDSGFGWLIVIGVKVA